MYCFVILLLFNEMQMSVRRFSAIPHLKTSRLTPDRVEKTVYFHWESLEFAADCGLEKNNLSKLESVFEGTFILNC